MNKYEQIRLLFRFCIEKQRIIIRWIWEANGKRKQDFNYKIWNYPFILESATKSYLSINKANFEKTFWVLLLFNVPCLISGFFIRIYYGSDSISLHMLSNHSLLTYWVVRLFSRRQLSKIRVSISQTWPNVFCLPSPFCLPSNYRAK